MVNAEQASKQSSRTPTPRRKGEGRRHCNLRAKAQNNQEATGPPG
jgi:hypothetical protein